MLEGRSLHGLPRRAARRSALAGGKYVEVPVDQAHVDGNLVTAPAWPAHPQWLARFLEVLGTRIEP